MLTDSQLVGRLREIVRCSDLRTTTSSAVRRRLEEEFAVDLYDRRAFINQQIDIFLQSVTPQWDDQETGEVDENVRNGLVMYRNACDRDQAASEEDVEEEGNNEEISRSKKRCTSVDAKEKNPGGIRKRQALSPQLQKFFGVSELAWTELLKKLWAYIREKNLQDPKDKRIILCDESLRGIFSVNSVDMFQMNKELVKHVWPVDDLRVRVRAIENRIICYSRGEDPWHD